MGGTERLRFGEGHGSPLLDLLLWEGAAWHGGLSLVLCGALEGWDGRGWGGGRGDTDTRTADPLRFTAETNGTL